MSTLQSVLMLGWEYPPHNSGGLGVACEGLTHALAEQQTQIYFTLPYHHTKTMLHMDVLSCLSPHLSTQQMGAEQPPFFAYSASIPLQASENLSFDPEVAKKLSDAQLDFKVTQYARSIATTVLNKQISPDLVHAHDWMTYPAASMLKRKLKTPFVAHIHSTEFDRVPNGQGNGFIAHTEYEGLQDADRVIAVSEFTKNILIEKYHIDPEKIDVIHNGVQQAPKIESLRFAQNRPVIVFMGRLTMQKGADYFLRLAREVIQTIPNALFVVAGHGDQYTMLLLENAKQRLSSSVIFAGFLRDSQKDFLLDRADIFVMPSISEPFGLVALEAVQRETPVIISKTSGVKEVLPGAISVDFWDIQAMAQHIKHLLSDHSYYEKVVDDQMKNLANLSWKDSADKVKQVYQRILNKRK